MKKIKINRIALAALGLVPIILTGCGKKNDCPYKGEPHVHRYTKEVDAEIDIDGVDDGKVTISKYLACETPTYGDYIRSDEVYIVPEEDLIFFDALDTEGGYFEISEENWPYLYDMMYRNREDTLFFKREYLEKEQLVIPILISDPIIIVEDYDYNIKIDYTTDPNDPRNTEVVVIEHTRYQGIKLVKTAKKNIFGQEKIVPKIVVSPAVEDIRDLLKGGYYYVKEDCRTTIPGISIHREKDPEIRKKLKPSDFYDQFEHPRLEDKTFPRTESLTPAKKKALQYTKNNRFNYTKNYR